VIRVKDLRAFDALGVGKVDAAVLFQVLEHMDEPMELLLQLAERVKPGGVLIVEVPDCRGLAVPRNFAEFRALHPLEHINAFTPGTLRRAVLKAGFHCIARPPAHVTTRWVDLARTEASRVLHRPTTNQYFLRHVPEGKA
jgi:2-polyprenyl-3-methyl-5-hydroxy-6-metoxy-1,4-benzoquinol methylase